MTVSRRPAALPGTAGARIAAAAVVLLALTGCAPAPDPQASQTPSSSAVSSSSSAPATTASTAPSPTPSASPPASSGGAPTSASRRTEPLTVFYVAINDGGGTGFPGPEIGCGDTLVSTTTAPKTFTNKVEAAIEHLLAGRTWEHGKSGLVNALYQSKLEYASSRISGDTVTVELSGYPLSGGTCDDPRIQEQLRHTAMAAAGTSKARILIDGTPIEEFMSQK